MCTKPAKHTFVYAWKKSRISKKYETRKGTEQNKLKFGNKISLSKQYI